MTTACIYFHSLLGHQISVMNLHSWIISRAAAGGLRGKWVAKYWEKRKIPRKFIDDRRLTGFFSPLGRFCAECIFHGGRTLIDLGFTFLHCSKWSIATKRERLTESRESVARHITSNVQLVFLCMHPCFMTCYKSVCRTQKWGSWWFKKKITSRRSPDPNCMFCWPSNDIIWIIHWGVHSSSAPLRHDRWPLDCSDSTCNAHLTCALVVETALCRDTQGRDGLSSPRHPQTPNNEKCNFTTCSGVS